MAIFKESKGSIRLLLIFFGGTGVLSGIDNIQKMTQFNPFEQYTAIITSIISISLLFFGIRLTKMLRNHAQVMIIFFWFYLVYSLVNLVLNYLQATRGGYEIENVAVTVLVAMASISILISLYLIHSIKRLAVLEAQSPPTETNTSREDIPRMS